MPSAPAGTGPDEHPQVDPGSWAGVCPDGQQVGPDTQNHCCWPGQAYSNLKAHCVGAPLCPAGTLPKGEECVVDCPEGMTKNADTAGHCCFPGQAWSSSRNACLGIPVCPEGMTSTPDGCLSLTAPPLPPTVPSPTGPPQQQPVAGPPPPVPLPEQRYEPGPPPPPQPPDRGRRHRRNRDNEEEEGDEEGDEPKDPWPGIGHVFFHLDVIWQPSDSAISPGPVIGPGLGLEIVPFRTSRVSFGLDAETGLVTSFFFNANRGRWVVPFRLGGLVGFRLASTCSEIEVHGGLQENWSGLSTGSNPSPWSSRIYGGAQFNFRFGTGHGYLFASLDAVVVDGIDLVGRVGWAF